MYSGSPICNHSQTLPRPVLLKSNLEFGLELLCNLRDVCICNEWPIFFKEKADSKGSEEDSFQGRERHFIAWTCCHQVSATCFERRAFCRWTTCEIGSFVAPGRINAHGQAANDAQVAELMFLSFVAEEYECVA